MAPLRLFALALAATTAEVLASTKEELLHTFEAQAKQIQDQTEQIEALLGKQASLEERFKGASEQSTEVGEAVAARRGRRLQHDFGQPRRLTAPPTADDIGLSTDTMWVILCGALVMFMQAGFAVLEAGSVRAKNCGTVLLKNLIDVCLGTIMWWLLGYGIAYGVDPAKAGTTDVSRAAGNQNFAGAAMVKLVDGSLVAPDSFLYPKDWFFQWAFCATAATIVSGGVAERIQLPVYIMYSCVMTGIIYPFVVYWTWSTEGWLTHFWTETEGDDSTKLGYSDFAGSGIVHLTGGIAALAGAALCGPRVGRFERPEEFSPHNLPLVVLGTFILWFGWYGFNCGSTLYLKYQSDALSAGLVAVNTTMSAAAGGLTVFLLRLGAAMVKKQEQIYDCAGMCNGILAGLVAVCAGAGSFEPGVALVVGIIGACFYEMGHYLMIMIKVDDPLDAFSVHGMAGIAGLLLKPLLRFEGADGDMFVAHLVGMLTIIAWSGGLTLIFLAPFKAMKMLAYNEEAQEKGSDVHCSPPKAYSQ